MRRRLGDSSTGSSRRPVRVVRARIGRTYTHRPWPTCRSPSIHRSHRRSRAPSMSRARSRAPSMRSGRSAAGTSCSSAAARRRRERLAALGGRLTEVDPYAGGAAAGWPLAGRIGRRRRRVLVGVPRRRTRRSWPRPIGCCGRTAGCSSSTTTDATTSRACAATSRAARLEPPRRAVPAGRVPDPGPPLLLDVRLARGGEGLPAGGIRRGRRGGRRRAQAAAPVVERRPLPPQPRPRGRLSGCRVGASAGQRAAVAPSSTVS